MAGKTEFSGKYDIFLSYRRDGGETMAILLRDRLVAKGYSVFLDVESLNAGSFNTELLRVIEGCTDFIVVLSKDSLDRCVNDGDWVRWEVSHAIKHEKNIIPVMLRGFTWPDALPEDIAVLPQKNGVNASSNEYFDAAIDRLAEKFLMSSPQKKQPKIKWWIPAASALIIAAVVILVVSLNGKNAPSGSVTPPSGTEQSTDDPNNPGGNGDITREVVDYFEDLPLTGNTVGNIANGGLAVAGEEFIYYAGEDYGIYKIDPVGLKKTKLATETGPVNNLNYYNGLLYYTTRNEIKSLDPNGAAAVTLHSAPADQMFVDSGEIFYTNSADSLKLYSLSLNGQVSRKLNDITGVLECVVSGGYYYFSDNNAGLKMFRTNLDGSEKTELTKLESRWTNVVGDHVFYAELGDSPRIVHIVPDSGDLKTVTDIPVSYLNVSEYGLFYTSSIANRTLCRLSFDGSTEAKLTDFPVKNINVAFNLVFFVDDNGTHYVAKIDGSELQKVTEIESDLSDVERVADRSFTYPDPYMSGAAGAYTGDWADGMPNGEGTILFDKKYSDMGYPVKYVGEWVNGAKHGQGTATWSDGSTYTGEFKNNMKDGNGKMTLADGSVYWDGAWANDAPLR